MNKEEFIDLLQNPNSVTNQQILSLESVLDEYPYFQAAQALQLKGLKLQRSFKYNNRLKKVAAYTTNRTILFDFITTDNFKEIKSTKKDILHNIEVVDLSLIKQIKESIKIQEKDSITYKEPLKNEVTTLNLKKTIEEQKDVLDIGNPIVFNKNDEFSFNEWLDLTPQKKIIRKKSTIKDHITDKLVDSKLNKQINLIENFITKKPKIKTPKSQEISNISMGSVIENSSLMTETLARVYLEQKKYNKAISAFKILSLKYPKKSSYFAEKIKAIEFLQKHK